MAYQKIPQSQTDLSDGQTTSNGMIGTQNSDNKTYYMAVRFSGSGVANVNLVGYGDPSSLSSANITVYVSESDSFNDTTGWPTSNIGISAGNPPSTSTRTIYKLRVTGGHWYYFWWRNVSSVYALAAVNVNFQESSTIWSDSRTIVGQTGTEYTRTIDPTDEYKLYCFSLSFTQTGTCRFEQTNYENTIMYVTTTYSNELYDWTTGLIDTSNPTVKDWSYGPSIIDVPISSAGTTYHFWIRMQLGGHTGQISISITPPGTVWTVTDLLHSGTQTIGVSGDSWSVGLLDNNEFLYIPITFATNGTYEFYQTSSEEFNGYITTSLSIDSDGEPVNTLASDTSSSGGFSFTWGGMTAGATYYFMFRTRDGNENYYNSTVGITYRGGASLWHLSSENIGEISSQSSDYFYFDDDYTLYRKVVKFSASGTARFYSQEGLSGLQGYPIGWITTHDSSGNIDDVNGAPPSGVTILASDTSTSGSRHFDMSASGVTAGVWYDFWFRLYDGTQSNRYAWICIVPPEGSTVTWYEDNRTSDSSLSGLSSNVANKACTINAAHTAKYVVSFANSGTATFYSSGSISVSGYVGALDNGISPSTGVPIYYDVHNVGSGNFTFSLAVSAGSTYYLWIKGNDETVSGTTYLSITVPVPSVEWHYIDQAERIVSGNNTLTGYYLNPAYGFKFLIRFGVSGSWTIRSTGSTDTAGYIGTTDNSFVPATGVPVSFDAESHSGGSGDNFSLTRSVTAGTLYYIWVKGEDATESGSFALEFLAPTPSTGGYVYIYNGSAWVRAKPYIYTGSGWVSATAYIYDGSSWKPTSS